MRKPHRSRGGRFVAVGAAIVLGAGLMSCKGEPTSPSLSPSVSATGQQAQQAGLAKAIQAKGKYAAQLMGRPDVVGVGVGLTTDGHPAVLVLAAAAPAPGLPSTLDGVPVRVLVTGPIGAIPPARPDARGGNPGPPGGSSGSGGSSLSTTSIWPAPVPIGVSTGNAHECAAGTISARVKAGSNVYALSNNHVYAREDAAVDTETVLQPGLYDTQCVNAGNNDLGTLTKFVNIDFSANAQNTVDAAIASTTTQELGQATPSGGYGEPSSQTTSAALNMAVQKYGRTTQLTHGQVTSIDLTVNVGYSTGTAQFVNQILVYSSHKAFLKAGDSGSLVVTDNSSANPVGLLFAGDNSGKYGIANQIDNVLSALNVSIDGK
jgi:hypothetical protein